MAKRKASDTPVARTFGGIVDDWFNIGKKLSISNRLHVQKVGSGDDEQEYTEEVRDVTFTTVHPIDHFQGSEYGTALAYDPTPRGQETLPDMENVELKAQPVKSVTIGYEQKTYGLTIQEGAKSYSLNPQHGLELKTIDITSSHPIMVEAKWTAKGVPYKEITRPLMELAHKGMLLIGIIAYSTAQINTMESKARKVKAHPGQGDLAETLEKPKRSRSVKAAAAEEVPRATRHRKKWDGEVQGGDSEATGGSEE